MRSCGRSRKVTVYSFANTTAAWWASVAEKLSKVRNLTVWQFAPEQVQALIQEDAVAKIRPEQCRKQAEKFSIKAMVDAYERGDEYFFNWVKEQRSDPREGEGID